MRNIVWGKSRTSGAKLLESASGATTSQTCDVGHATSLHSATVNLVSPFSLGNQCEYTQMRLAPSITIALTS